MADSILRLKVDSNEYESKLKRASQALLSMADEAKRTGASLALADQQELAFVNSLGKLETSARGAKGTLSELSNTIQNLTMHYNKLSEEDRNSQYGKNLKNSIDELKARHKELKGQMDETSKSMQDQGGALEALADKFCLSIKQVGLFGTALAVGKAAMETLKSTVESTEYTHDDFARVIASCDSISNQFFRTLANADFSNFLSGLDSIIAKSIEAYNTLDDYESYMARFNADQQKIEAQIQLNLMKIRAAKAQGDTATAKILVEQTQQLINSLSDITKVAGQKQTDSAYATIKDLAGNVNFTNSQIDWYANSKNWDEANAKAQKYRELMSIIAKGKNIPNISAGSYMPGMGPQGSSRVLSTSSETEAARRAQAELDRDPSLLRAYTFQNLRDSGGGSEAQRFLKALIDLGGNIYAQSRVESLQARLDRSEATIGSGKGSGSGGGKKSGTGGGTEVIYPEGSIGDLEKQISDLESSKKLQTTKEGVAAIDAQIKELQDTLKSLKGDIADPIDLSFSSEGIKNYVKELQAKYKEVGGSDALRNNLIDSATIANLFGSALNNGIDISEFNGEELWKKILNEEDIPDDIWKGILDRINEKLAESGIGQLDLNFKNGIVSSVKPTKTSTKKEKSGADDALENVSKGLSGLSQISGGLESMGIELSSGFKDTLNIVQGLMSVIKGVQSIISIFSTTSLAANTAAVIANTAALATNSFTNILPFAEGGFLPAAANGIIAGSQYHGDTRAIRVNDGEMIINQTDQAKLYNAIHGDSLSFGNGSSVDIIRGENIYLSMRNYMKRTGRRLPA